ncbi:hypothetical protein O6H91_02G007800 [Diphasiastrum complanatum]|uniref:Uncharacterized protein n=1 Tax=Diphasiastrum complanatum TaxID=34168 RepID=A0ACC2ECJ8_DIPCM|nr:hypothetical protein O6H91_02G007800 [Diphasiastrum complanatum]
MINSCSFCLFCCFFRVWLLAVRCCMRIMESSGRFSSRIDVIVFCRSRVEGRSRFCVRSVQIGLRQAFSVGQDLLLHGSRLRFTASLPSVEICSCMLVGREFVLMPAGRDALKPASREFMLMSAGRDGFEASRSRVCAHGSRSRWL